MLGGSLAGVDAGTRLLAYLTGLASWHISGRGPVPAVEVVLDILFIVLLGFVAALTLHDAWIAGKRLVPRGDRTIPGPLITRACIPPYIDLPRVELHRVSIPMMAAIGFGLGAASGVMGIGGGVLFMPILLYGFGLSVRNAAGTGVLLLFVTVVVGTVEQAMRGFVSIPLALIILIGSSVGSQLGALTTHYLPNRVLRLIFAGLVVATLAMIAWALARIVR
jgi:uncharacterized membrane protein YfcA